MTGSSCPPRSGPRGASAASEMPARSEAGPASVRRGPMPLRRAPDALHPLPVRAAGRILRGLERSGFHATGARRRRFRVGVRRGPLRQGSGLGRHRIRRRPRGLDRVGWRGWRQRQGGFIVPPGGLPCHRRSQRQPSEKPQPDRASRHHVFLSPCDRHGTPPCPRRTPGAARKQPEKTQESGDTRCGQAIRGREKNLTAPSFVPWAGPEASRMILACPTVPTPAASR